MPKLNRTAKLAKQQAGQPIQLVLLEPGKEGWTTPKLHPSFTQKSLLKDKLTTEELQQFLNIPYKIIGKCPIGKVIPWGCYLIWHQGRDKWRVYQQIAA